MLVAHTFLKNQVLVMSTSIVSRKKKKPMIAVPIATTIGY